MNTFAPRSGLSDAARITFTAALLLFIATIVIGILNGIDLWEPDHDSLIGHVHAGTLGWITLGVSGIAFLMFSRDRDEFTVPVSVVKRDPEAIPPRDLRIFGLAVEPPDSPSRMMSPCCTSVLC